MSNSTVGGLMIIALIAIYFLPSMISGIRSHRNDVAIFMLNVFLGWTFIGWVAALVWSCTGDVRPPRTRAAMKQCPHCAEPILAAAVKCKHCGSDLTVQQAS